MYIENCKYKLFKILSTTNYGEKRIQQIVLKCGLIAQVSTPVKFLFKT